MKLYIFAILLIIGGVSNITEADTALGGIVCALLGVAIIAFKIITNSKNEREQAEKVEQEENIRRERIVYESSVREEMRKRDEYERAVNRWQGIMDEHYRLIDQIGVAYTVANNLSLPDSPEMQKVIELCKKDIAIAELFKKAYIERTQAQVKAGYVGAEALNWPLPNYSTFKRLAIIYEKQKKYDDAIAICQQAIELGYVDDGTEGKMPGRVARLIKKKGKEIKKIKPAEQIIIQDTEVQEG